MSRTTKAAAPAPATPEHVAIVAYGPSMHQYVDLAKALGNRKRLADQTWGINAVASVLDCDLAFHMDDVRIQQVRAEADADSNIVEMLKWLSMAKMPVFTSRPHPDFPSLVEYPLERVLNATGGFPYFNSTPAYAIALALAEGVKILSLFGLDYTYANVHDAEKGRACVEFHLGIAKSRGIAIGLPAHSTLMDGIATEKERLYGYDTLDLDIAEDEHGKIRIDATVITDLPSAEEIERRYDHSRHPNRLVEAENAKR